MKILTISTGIDFPHAAQAIQIRRRRRRLDQPKRFTTETVYAITDLRIHQAKPTQLAGWIRGHWSIENKVHWVRDVTYDEDRSQIRTGTGPEIMAALHNAARPTPERSHQHRRRQPASRPRQHPPPGTTRHHLTTLPGPCADTPCSWWCIAPGRHGTQPFRAPPKPRRVRRDVTGRQAACAARR
ncbi:hypothetical protein RM555_06390 [Micromonospora sp. DSM 115977]|uniref:Transposase DDE domain-containing protein n=1 Tax=Micromonospora reichwaldensis TaxID=3075516 RepID=A0ABU2WTN6_9ACTN|nr:hypothetical protein [Micromonospora sp. DSM 115977]MDT0528619.1 hypothetical protein [Micromonospora sp. DSM 115977]